MKNENIDIQDNFEDYEMYIMHLRKQQLIEQSKEVKSDLENDKKSGKIEDPF
jgi:hypothetical protein